MHQLGQAFCDRKPQSVSFRIPGTVSTDKSSEKFLAGHFQSILRNIAEGHNHHSVKFFQRNIHTCSRLCILTYISHQVVNDPPQMSAIHIDFNGWLRTFYNHLQLICLCLFRKFPDNLCQNDRCITYFRIHRKISGRCFGCLHQILNQFFQTVGLSVKHLNVLPHCFTLCRLLFDQIHIVDNGSKRCFNIMGDIGDQFGTKPLTLHFFFYRRCNSGLYII